MAPNVTPCICRVAVGIDCPHEGGLKHDSFITLTDYGVGIDCPHEGGLKLSPDQGYRQGLSVGIDCPHEGGLKLRKKIL